MAGYRAPLSERLRGPDTDREDKRYTQNSSHAVGHPEDLLFSRLSTGFQR